MPHSTTWIPPPPPDPDTLKNPQPFSPFPLIQLRAGKIKKSLGNGRIESAIFKHPLAGPVEIKKSGITTDEHAYEPHRSPDKALLHYCTSHYEEWRKEVPASEHLFKPGAFGENLYNKEISEKTVCIGDRIAIGEVIVEVSEPRSPCFKLNHRFETKDMAKRTQTLFRTGWLYRIIKPGIVQAGDMIRLLERPYPEWAVARVMYYLFIETGNMEMMKEIVELGPLGDDIKSKFSTRIAKGKVEDQSGRWNGAEHERMDTWSEYRIVEKRKETSKIMALTLEAVDETQQAVAVEPGSHVRLKLGGKLVRAYSVVGGTLKRFVLGIALESESRGGSKYLHEQAAVNDILAVSRITSSFPLVKDASQHVIIAGGIGITAFLAAVKHLKETNQKFQLHYSVTKEIPFSAQLAALGTSVIVYNKSLGQRKNLDSILAQADSGTHIYTCGPTRMVEDIEAIAKKYSIPDSSVHFETFSVTTSGDPFSAELRQSKRTVHVGPSQSLLDALKAVGMDVDSSCEVGNCGTCRVDVCGGRIDHRGTGLLEEEKCMSMLSCVSRGIGDIVLDL